MFEKANCRDVPKDVPSDAGIAGTGVLLSFIFTAGISLVLSASLIIQDALLARRNDDRTLAGDRRQRRPPHAMRRKLLSSYSDQQIMTGIGIQSVGLAKAGTLVPYHFFLVWMLSLLSMAVHNAALLALARDFRRDWVLRWLRQALMLANLALSCVCGVYLLQSARRGLQPTLPIACVWDSGAAAATATATATAGGGGGGGGGGSGGSSGNVGLDYVGTIVVIAGNVVVFALATWYLHGRTRRFYRATQLAGVALMGAIAVGAAVRTILLSQAFGRPSVALRDRGEREWSFGQLLSLLLLVLPLVSVIEIYRGEIQVALPVEDEKTNLFDGEMQAGGAGSGSSSVRQSFQPNPFFGSQTSLFKK